jgi:hypothetical protein
MGIFSTERVWLSPIQKIWAVQIVTVSPVQGESSNELAYKVAQNRSNSY